MALAVTSGSVSAHGDDQLADVGREGKDRKGKERKGREGRKEEEEQGGAASFCSKSRDPLTR